MFKKSGGWGGSLVLRVTNSASVAVGDLSREFLVRWHALEPVRSDRIHAVFPMIQASSPDESGHYKRD